MASSVDHDTDGPFPNLRRAVVRGYLDASEHMVAEVLDGELSTLPRPRPRHSHAAGRLLGALDAPFGLGRGGPGGWIFLIEPEVHLGTRPDIVAPDLAGWHLDRLPADVFGDDAPGAITVVPDWVCEVLSDSTEALDRGKKRRIYRREGVGHYWLVDPRERILEVLRQEEGHWIEAGEFQGDVTVRAAPFNAVELDLSLLWSPSR